MKASSVTLALAVASVASAQLDVISKAPKCAIQCVLSGLGKSSCDSTFDLKCQCKEADGLIGQIVPCVKKACDYDDQDAARTLAIDTCKNFGVSISLPQPESRTQDATMSGSTSGLTSATATTTDASNTSDASPTSDSSEPTSSPTSGGGGGSDGGSDDEGGSDSESPDPSAATATGGAMTNTKPGAGTGTGVVAALLAIAAYL